MVFMKTILALLSAVALAAPGFAQAPTTLTSAKITLQIGLIVAPALPSPFNGEVTTLTFAYGSWTDPVGDTGTYSYLYTAGTGLVTMTQGGDNIAVLTFNAPTSGPFVAGTTGGTESGTFTAVLASRGPTPAPAPAPTPTRHPGQQPTPGAHPR
jgi:hypothetical protein